MEQQHNRSASTAGAAGKDGAVQRDATGNLVTPGSEAAYPDPTDERRLADRSDGAAVEDSQGWDAGNVGNPAGFEPADNAADNDIPAPSWSTPPRDDRYYRDTPAYNKDSDTDTEAIDFSSDAAIQEEIAEREGSQARPAPPQRRSQQHTTTGPAENAQDFITGGPLDDKSGRR